MFEFERVVILTRNVSLILKLHEIQILIISSLKVKNADKLKLKDNDYLRELCEGNGFGNRHQSIQRHF